MKTTVIFHSADYDGIFCREIARKFLPDAQLIGWDFGDKPLPLYEGQIYVMDLPLDRVFGWSFEKGTAPDPKVWIGLFQRIVWIDHHKSSIESHPITITGYRIDGVAACRLAWQWFEHELHAGNAGDMGLLPDKDDFIHRQVTEPLAVRLAGEYDIWDHRGDGDVEFQFGLDCDPHLQWDKLLSAKTWDDDKNGGLYVFSLKIAGEAAMQCYKKRDADIMRSRSFMAEWEDLKFLCLNTARCNSNAFAWRDIPATGHDALLAFYFNGQDYSFSLYHAAHRKDLDLSLIAVKYGGGGHRGACGFRTNELPF